MLQNNQCAQRNLKAWEINAEGSLGNCIHNYHVILWFTNTKFVTLLSLIGKNDPKQSSLRSLRLYSFSLLTFADRPSGATRRLRGCRPRSLKVLTWAYVLWSFKNRQMACKKKTRYTQEDLQFALRVVEGDKSLSALALLFVRLLHCLCIAITY